MNLNSINKWMDIIMIKTNLWKIMRINNKKKKNKKERCMKEKWMKERWMKEKLMKMKMKMVINKLKQ